MENFKNKIYFCLIILYAAIPTILLGCGEPNRPESVKKVCEEKKTETVEEKIDELAKSSEGIKSYQAEIVSVFKQPLLEAQTVRKGMMYYTRDANSSALRINFFTRQDDEEEPEEDIQQYFFDGVWLSRINFTTKHIEKRQMAREEHAVDAMNLVSENFPLVGFSDTDKLEEDFIIEQASNSDSNSVGNSSEKIHLIPRKNGRYYDEYQYIDFLVDKNSKLPVLVESLTSEEDIYELSFLNTRINEKIDPNVFFLSMPKDFSIEVIKLENK